MQDANSKWSSLSKWKENSQWFFPPKRHKYEKCLSSGGLIFPNVSVVHLKIMNIEYVGSFI